MEAISVAVLDDEHATSAVAVSTACSRAASTASGWAGGGGTSTVVLDEHATDGVAAPSVCSQTVSTTGEWAGGAAEVVLDEHSTGVVAAPSVCSQTVSTAGEWAGGTSAMEKGCAKDLVDTLLTCSTIAFVETDEIACARCAFVLRRNGAKPASRTRFVICL